MARAFTLGWSRLRPIEAQGPMMFTGFMVSSSSTDSGTPLVGMMENMRAYCSLISRFINNNSAT